MASLWICVNKGVKGPKLRSLTKTLKCSKAEALGILVSLWLWAMDGNAESSGLIKNADESDIADVINNEISKKLDASTVVKALIEAEWIDVKDGELYIHDWAEHQKYYVSYCARKERDLQRKRKAASSNGEDTQESDSSEYAKNRPVEETKRSPSGEANSTGATTRKAKEERSKGFEAFYAAYPRKIEPATAYKKYKARIADGYSDAELLLAAQAYAAECRQRHTEKEYIKHPKTFLSDALPFLEYLPSRNESSTSQPQNDGNPFSEYGGG